MKVADFDYYLPEELIAQHPTESRDHSRLLLLDKKTGIYEDRPFFYQLLEELQEGDVLVFNNTRVIPARLFGKRKGSGGRVEVLLLSPLEDTTWECLVKPGGKAKPGQIITFSEEVEGTIIESTDFGGRIISFHEFDGKAGEGTINMDMFLERFGEMPLPPYIHEKLTDKERYQTVYAREKGSAAAPTAGLHFTPQLLDAIKKKGVEIVFVTLHVGLGTFRPVSTEHIEDHLMHKELYEVSEESAAIVNRAKQEGRRIIAVGTTSVRTLESATKKGILQAGKGDTSIFIYPGYQYQMVDALVTNFHLPQSTLLMLISALATREYCLAAYAHAVQEKYRFFSFGDAMFIR